MKIQGIITSSDGDYRERSIHPLITGTTLASKLNMYTVLVEGGKEIYALGKGSLYRDNILPTEGDVVYMDLREFPQIYKGGKWRYPIKTEEIIWRGKKSIIKGPKPICQQVPPTDEELKAVIQYGYYIAKRRGLVKKRGYLKPPNDIQAIIDSTGLSEDDISLLIH
ncbi:hypothetical protein K8R33_02625 [archaeon]|nr:hypothetical protein [archaeon]